MGPLGDSHGGGTQLTSEPSGLTGWKVPPGALCAGEAVASVCAFA